MKKFHTITTSTLCSMMLTGELQASSGDAKVKGHSVTKNLAKARTFLGYCPQFDALHPRLTTRETLQLYADIRNIPKPTVSQTIDEMIEELGLSRFSDKLAGDLSGGNKRKLSTAIALMGKPPVVFLDEPTTGMDPKSRRFLWSCIEEMIKGGTCIILTSHSMEECQALCTKLTIMVNGQFRCLGSAQHLKKKYGKGYQIIIRFPLDKKAQVMSYVSKIFPTSLVDEEHLNQIRYRITNIKVSTMFIEMERAKNDGLIKDFSVSQTTLEEVFMAFASQQEYEVIVEPKPFLLSRFLNFLTRKKKSDQDEKLLQKAKTQSANRLLKEVHKKSKTDSSKSASSLKSEKNPSEMSSILNKTPSSATNKSIVSDINFQESGVQGQEVKKESKSSE